MKRRQFLSVSGSVVFGTALLSQDSMSRNRSGSLKAVDVDEALRSLCDVEEPSVDRIIIGRPETLVIKIGTCWMPDWNTLKRAVKLGINTLVVHEPTFYDHWDAYDKRSISWEAPEAAKEVYYKAIQRKRRWIENNDLVIIRCHDVLDKVPEFGIPFALGQALGFTNRDIVRSHPYFNVYGVEPSPAIDIARRIASRLKVVGQPGVAFYGDPQVTVGSVGLGTGCISNPIEFMDLKADLYLSIDDVVRTWIQTTFAEDTGQPLVVINHGTSEEFGMRSLNTRLKSLFAGYDVIHLEQGCSYRWISA